MPNEKPNLEVKKAILVKETPFDAIKVEFLMQAGVLEKKKEIIAKAEKLAKIYNIKLSYTNAGIAYNFSLRGERRNVQKFIDVFKKTS